MDSIENKRILLLITNTYAAINVIHSGLIRAVAAGHDVCLLSDILDEEARILINKKFSVHIQRIDLPIYEESVFLKMVRRLEKLLFMNHFRIETQQIKNKELSWLHRLVVCIINCLTWFPTLSAFLLRFLRRLIIQYPHIHFPEPLRFDGVISTSPLDIRENAIVNYLKKRHVRSLAILISWDNLTSKGVINADHDYLLVWNRIMAKEYNQFYSVLSEQHTQVEITGIPRFDVYEQSENVNANNEARSDIPDSPHIILFATSAAKHFPYQADILGHLLEYAEQKKNVKILLRCHPGDDVAKYRQYKNHPLLTIDDFKPITANSSIPDLDNLKGLADALRSCAVCVQVASTIRLEAALCNKPVLSVAYDGNATMPEHLSVKRLYSYSHQLALNKLGIDQMIYNKGELFLQLDTQLSGKQRVENRFKLLDFIPHTKLTASRITTNCINRWLR